MSKTAKSSQLNIKTTLLYIFLVVLGFSLIYGRPFGLPINGYIFWLLSRVAPYQTQIVIGFITGVFLVTSGIFGLYKKVAFKDLPKIARLLIIILLAVIAIQVAVTITIVLLFQSYSF